MACMLELHTAPTLSVRYVLEELGGSVYFGSLIPVVLLCIIRTLYYSIKLLLISTLSIQTRLLNKIKEKKIHCRLVLSNFDALSLCF